MPRSAGARSRRSPLPLHQSRRKQHGRVARTVGDVALAPFLPIPLRLCARGAEPAREKSCSPRGVHRYTAHDAARAVLSALPLAHIPIGCAREAARRLTIAFAFPASRRTCHVAGPSEHHVSTRTRGHRPYLRITTLRPMHMECTAMFCDPRGQVGAHRHYSDATSRVLRPVHGYAVSAFSLSLACAL